MANTNMILAYENYVEDSRCAVTVTAPSASFPAANVQDNTVGTQSRASQQVAAWDVDLGIARPDINFWFLGGCTPGMTVSVQGSVTSTFSTTSFTSVTLAEGVLGNYWATASTVYDYRFWRFAVTVPASEAETFLPIGEASGTTVTAVGVMFVGPRVVMDRNPGQRFSDRQDYGSTRVSTYHGISRVYSRRIQAAGQFNFLWGVTGPTAYAQLKACQKWTRGAAKRLVMVPDPDGGAQAYWGTLSDGLDYQGNSPGWYEFGDVQLDFTEEPVALTVTRS